jgi:hypothetical protein
VPDSRPGGSGGAVPHTQTFSTFFGNR